MTVDLKQLFNDLVNYTHADVDRRGEAHIVCPECGHESSPKRPHCSFSMAGFYCFVCGYKASLPGLAKRLGFQSNSEYMPVKAARKAQKKPRTSVPVWMTAERSAALLERFESHPRRMELWQAYKPISAETIERQRLGVGVLPASRCKHERLIVPIFNGTLFAGFRGRSLGCDCAKWLAPGGTQLDLYSLYNDQALTPGCVVWIVENPIDALLLTERTDFVGVATYSTTYWRDPWTEALRAVSPELVVIAFDNDIPGNGGGVNRPQLVREWLRTHRTVPEPRGPKLANTLIKAGLPAVLYDWPAGTPNKFDIGSLLVAAGV